MTTSFLYFSLFKAKNKESLFLRGLMYEATPVRPPTFTRLSAMQLTKCRVFINDLNLSTLVTWVKIVVIKSWLVVMIFNIEYRFLVCFIPQMFKINEFVWLLLGIVSYLTGMKNYYFMCVFSDTRFFNYHGWNRLLPCWWWHAITIDWGVVSNCQCMEVQKQPK